MSRHRHLPSLFAIYATFTYFLLFKPLQKPLSLGLWLAPERFGSSPHHLLIASLSSYPRSPDPSSSYATFTFDTCINLVGMKPSVSLHIEVPICEAPVMETLSAWQTRVAASQNGDIHSFFLALLSSPSSSPPTSCILLYYTNERFTTLLLFLPSHFFF